MYRIVIVVLVSVVATTSVASANECANYADTLQVVGSVAWWPAEGDDITLSGDYAYVACDYIGVRTIDVSDPENPTVTSFIDSIADAYGVDVSGSYLYVAAEKFWVLDITTPASPAVVTSLVLPDPSFGVEVVGTKAYVAGGYSGLHVIDVSTPSQPAIDGSVDTPWKALEVAVSEGYAYVADGAGLVVVDVSDPTSPTVAGSVPSTLGDFRGVAVSGNYAYVATGVLDGSAGWGGFEVVDISIASAPVVVGSLYYGQPAHHVAIRDGYAFLPMGIPDYYWSAVGPSAKQPFVLQGLNIIDISVPSMPTLVNGIEAPDDAFGIALAGDYAYVGYENGFMVVDIDCETVTAVGGNIPQRLTLRNSPNPFNPSTMLSFDLPLDDEVQLSIYSVAGQKIRTLLSEFTPAGRHSVRWDGTNLRGEQVASGVYYALLRTPAETKIRKIVLVK